MKEKDLKRYKLRNDTTRFLLPLTGVKRSIIETEDFINAYLYVSDLNVENHIYLVYKTPQKLIEAEISPLKYNVGEYTVYAVKVPETALKRFIEGAYSKLEDEHKQTILKFWDLHKHSRMHNILYPDDYMFEIATFPLQKLFHKREIWPRPNPIKETFTYGNSNTNSIQQNTEPIQSKN